MRPARSSSLAESRGLGGGIRQGRCRGATRGVAGRRKSSATPRKCQDEGEGRGERRRRRRSEEGGQLCTEGGRARGRAPWAFEGCIKGMLEATLAVTPQTNCSHIGRADKDNVLCGGPKPAHVSSPSARLPQFSHHVLGAVLHTRYLS